MPTDTTKVCLVSVTPDAEKTIGYIARVSNPKNQENPNVSGLLKYCIKHGHWSVFEQASMTLEISTTRAIAAQILRHRSFTFQEFSQRYADASQLDNKIPMFDLRRQDTKNRQNSIDDVDEYTKQRYEILVAKHFDEAMDLYKKMVEDGIAKECARFVLPLATPTKLYMTGNLRNWIHYIQLREKNGTQLEHKRIADIVKTHFICQFPIISSALDWCPDEDCGCPEDWDDLQPCLRID